MSRIPSARTATMSLAVALLVVGCGDANPSGLPYANYEMAGTYTPTDASGSKNMRLVLGTRQSLSGSYENAVGENVRFYGTWQLLDGDRLVLYLDGGAGLAGEAVLDVARERIVTEIPPSPPAVGPPGPPGPPQFDYTDIRRLRGAVEIEGIVVELDLFCLTTVTGGAGGGQTAN